MPCLLGSDAPPWPISATNFDALEETALYRTLDQLYPHRVAIERALVERERSLFNLDPAIYLYDTILGQKLPKLG
jgi:hypothetical protein